MKWGEVELAPSIDSSSSTQDRKGATLISGAQRWPSAGSQMLRERDRRKCPLAELPHGVKAYSAKWPQGAGSGGAQLPW